MNASVTASQMTRRMEDVGAGIGERASVIGRLRWCQQEKEAATWQRRRHQRGNDPADGAAAGSGGKQQGGGGGEADSGGWRRSRMELLVPPSW